MGTGSVSGHQSRPPIAPRPLDAPAGPAAAGPASGAASAPAHSAAAGAAQHDSFAAGTHAATQAGAAGAAPRPSADRAGSRSRVGGATAERPNPRDNPQVFDTRGRMSPAALAGLTQYDNDARTTGDPARCAANSSVAALAMRGNESLSRALSNASADVARQMGQATGDPARLAELAGIQVQLTTLAAKAAMNNIQRNDLNTAADLLYNAYDSNRTGDNIMTYPDIAKMNQGLGLMPSSTTDATAAEGRNVGHVTYQPPNPPSSDFNVNTPAFRNAQRQVADDVIGRLQNGDSALVGIFNGAGGTDKPNHIINVGKNAQGEVFVYNPDNNPNYLTGHAAQEHLRSHIGIGLRNPQDTHGPGGQVTSRTYDVYPAATIMMQNRNVTSPAAH